MIELLSRASKRAKDLCEKTLSEGTLFKIKIEVALNGAKTNKAALEEYLASG